MADNNDTVTADMNEAGQTQTEQDGGIDFEAAADEIDSNPDWFNPSQGTHHVTFLDNGQKDTRDYEGETREIVVFKVEVDGEELLWSVTKGSSSSSLYGQLVRLGAAREGLAGTDITLIANGEGKDRTYTVQEAADL